MVTTFRNDSYFTEADEDYVFGPDDTKAGMIISLVGFIGVSVQSVVVTGAYNIKNMKGTVFGALILNETFSQFAATSITFFFFFVGIFLNTILIVSNSAIFGNISLTILPIMLGTHFLMAFNRFCASSMPFGYRKIFSKNYVLTYIIINWTLPPVIYSYFFFFYNCSFPFFQFGWVFMEAQRNETCGAKLLLLSLSVQFVIIFIITILDISTFIILITCRKSIFKGQSKENKQRDINFAMQVIIQGIVMVFFGVWYVSGYSFLPGNRLDWKIFMTTTVSSSLTNCLAPIVICFFNAEYRRWIIRLIRREGASQNLTVVLSRTS
ncbi:7TM GPCR serpentine receptor class x (Srx) domain-containing protein [Caenorhabditis elegans]|uniref:7TM GPCR serpentine receptor class x (Srx) domain-containing protein n=1 Tax=Caenorhabditis elegans TaxID=6239 RepID=O45768_CAEEL|nr:7TM GPCR serpentine receptor class x (Srx) domain-containing protein [Caenorhabditis elegans]CAB07661.3 7TM GPCR serpentine receptor class x (Srx) domain-containing protein [Caenorhabditis elegans]|eukprot:NP_507023.3 Serpentine Receptor, class X [Caenorhabditis elegans]